MVIQKVKCQRHELKSVIEKEMFSIWKGKGFCKQMTFKIMSVRYTVGIENGRHGRGKNIDQTVNNMKPQKRNLAILGE